MKKILIFIFLIIGITLISGCGSDNTAGNRIPDGTSQVLKVLEEQMAATDGNNTSSEVTRRGSDTAAPTPVPGISAEALSTEEGIDVDLTQLSSTMVYAEVYNMMVNPEVYMGKRIKMSGTMNVLYDAANDKYYFACIITDATACCAQGVEFVLTDDYRIPEDYPEAGTEITVVGTFDTYWEINSLYCTLRGSKLL